jgi:hypothetical protein
MCYGGPSNRVNTESSGLIEGDCIPSQFSKLHLMYSTTDVAFVAIDFAKGNEDDGVIDSPPSRSAGRMPVCLPSPLQGGQLNPIRQRQRSSTHQNIHTPQR